MNSSFRVPEPERRLKILLMEQGRSYFYPGIMQQSLHWTPLRTRQRLRIACRPGGCQAAFRELTLLSVETWSSAFSAQLIFGFDESGRSRRVAAQRAGCSAGRIVWASRDLDLPHARSLLLRVIANPISGSHVRYYGR